ncbi:MAG TPA: ribosome small subunit-dependent GTPase A [Bacilli bacterium]|nr:ribosome small subunit-dependent GTPase A [Bacilli bacterium]HPZ27912.1 ribosome small subunit-dependent GTPase A [Bacilli bacterium]HQC89163.1 ribosome small subunit-dependent GTPase A [Bacilli bacterium]
MRGLIIKAISGEYTIIDQENKIHVAKPRGLFRFKEHAPKVGDWVEFDAKHKVIQKIARRRNELNRPVIANVDKVFLVFSVREPDLNLRLLDRLLAIIEYMDIEIVIVFTKLDLLADRGDFDQINEYYRSIGYKTYLSGLNAIPVKEIKAEIDGYISVLAGQSGAGKSTLLNALDPSFQLKTDVISRALGRGKHTTRHVELLRVEGGWIADTPGFGNVDFDIPDLLTLSHSFREFFAHSDKCKFNRCLHLDEPGCAIKDMVADGVILHSRYQNYALFYREVEIILKNKY